MTFTFAILAVVTLAGAIAAMSLRNLVHCALCLVAAFGGLAGLFLQLDAQFVGLAQILVYIGAVAILIVFAILLTRGSQPAQQPILTGRWLMGAAVAALTFGSLMVTVLNSAVIWSLNGPKLDVAADISVKNIGVKLMTDYVLPLEVVALLLTAALIGAVIIAMKEEK
ncbi:MAG TPA: NADH-quinone oxidoreductase subunit J [Verrucomicrobiae bacterium]|nr:NADH-quinone oxidoreductase subunit J [Verrucomicrobiae bacterium]